MACNLTLGRSVPCKDQVGGVRKVFFANNGGLTITYNGTDTDQVDAIGTATVYEYDLKDETASFTENVQPSPENGTTFWEQVLELAFHKLTKEDHKELKLMAYGNPHIFILDNNDNLFVMGLESGADVTAGTIERGTAKGDFTGYRYTFTAKEKAPANFVIATAGSSASGYPFDNVTSGTVTITTA